MAKKEINWEKIKSELKKIKDFDSLKKELIVLKKEIQKLNIHDYLSPSAANQLKTLEKRYADVSKKIQKAQAQLDQEFTKALDSLKKVKVEAEKSLKSITTRFFFYTRHGVFTNKYIQQLFKISFKT